MDSWKDHLAFGVVLQIPLIIILFIFPKWYHYTGVTSVSFWISIFQILVLIVISPLIMDVDHKLGKLREGLTFLGLSIGSLGVVGYFFNVDLTILMVYGIIIAGASFLLCYTTHHRGYTHTIPFVLVYGVITTFILGDYQMGVLASYGCYTHLIADKIPLKIF